VQLKFVQQSRCQVPLPDLSISHDIPVPGAKQNSAARPGSVLKFARNASNEFSLGFAGSESPAGRANGDKRVRRGRCSPQCESRAPRSPAQLRAEV
jgi:hypothetical protein